MVHLRALSRGRAADVHVGAVLALKGERGSACDDAQLAAAGAMQELQSPTKQEVAEMLEVELSPECKRAEPAAARDDKRVVETETLLDTMDDGYRRALPACRTCRASPGMSGRHRHVCGQQVAQVRAENCKGQPAPAQLLQMYIQGVQCSQARRTLCSGPRRAGDHVRGEKMK